MSEPSFYHLTSSVDQGVLVLTITDRKVQGHETAEALRQEMLAALVQAGVCQVVVNFRNTQCISSVAFMPLLNLRRKLQEMTGRIVLCGLSKEVGDVFYTTRMISPTGAATSLFEMEPDVPAAIAHLTQSV